MPELVSRPKDMIAARRLFKAHRDAFAQMAPVQRREALQRICEHDAAIGAALEDLLKADGFL